MMEIYAVPIEGKFIIYRPLRRLAFVGNRAMADLALDLAERLATSESSDTPNLHAGLAQDAVEFLQTIGFLEPDPPPPPPPSPSYCPTTAVLLLTGRCNLRCTYCYASGGEGPGQDISLDLARVVIDRVYQNALELGQPQFDLTFHGGGEPLQAWDTLQEATAYAKAKDLPCRVSMVSNGICTNHQRDWLIDNLDSFSISFDGRPETQDNQRPFAAGPGSFKAVMRTIEALDQAKFSYGIRMTATAPWRTNLPEDVRFICEETGCPAMQVEPAFNTRRGVHQGPTLEESDAFVDAFMEAWEIAGQARRSLSYSGARPWLLTQSFCTAPHAALIANPEGKLVACYEITDQHHPLVELSAVGRIEGERVVVDERAREALRATLESRRAACHDCFCQWHCAGDCFTRGYTSSQGGLPGASPRCHMNREITARILLWYIMNSDGVWRGQGAHPQEAQLMRTF